MDFISFFDLPVQFSGIEQYGAIPSDRFPSQAPSSSGTLNLKKSMLGRASREGRHGFTKEETNR
jgi:hypothetical protein